MLGGAIKHFSNKQLTVGSVPTRQIPAKTTHWSPVWPWSVTGGVRGIVMLPSPNTVQLDLIWAKLWQEEDAESSFLTMSFKKCLNPNKIRLAVQEATSTTISLAWWTLEAQALPLQLSLGARGHLPSGSMVGIL